MAGRDKKFGTRHDKNVPLASATYNASAHTVRLIPKQAFNKTQLQQLRVKAAFLSDICGRPLDGNHDGQPGGDFTASMSKNKVTILSAAQAKAAPRTTAAAVDIVLQEPSFAGSAAIRRRRALGR